ncbi:hypothetical protein B0J11DRAFT_95002 [Dendryphion nanum]|uniref:Uncharacterized protein n=1 Tax=Dendryphion nanum TaxID=256645 RepID=A0A9P9DF88_9PLEO|nr:hypothetical protein B0J11DRAFT_95002 [Dendryphion nanum]
MRSYPSSSEAQAPIIRAAPPRTVLFQAVVLCREMVELCKMAKRNPFHVVIRRWGGARVPETGTWCCNVVSINVPHMACQELSAACDGAQASGRRRSPWTISMPSWAGRWLVRRRDNRFETQWQSQIPCMSRLLRRSDDQRRARCLTRGTERTMAASHKVQNRCIIQPTKRNGGASICRVPMRGSTMGVVVVMGGCMGEEGERRSPGER